MAKAKKSTSVFPGILWGVILPSLVLEKGGPHLGSGLALALGISMPLGYGAWTYFKEKTFSWIALLGLLNVALSGALALSGKGGIWFSVKEAAFPLLIGLFVLVSSWTAAPFVSRLLLNPQTVEVELIDEKIKSLGLQKKWVQHLRLSNILFSLSFFLSAYLNFYLAQKIFLPLDTGLDDLARQELLNQQLGAMNRKSYLVIVLPTLVFSMAIFWYLINGLGKMTGLKMEDVFSKEAK
jgi:hypothetical protein